jgi:hypothetical protein
MDDADTIEGAREIVRAGKPGRYHSDPIGAHPLPSGHMSRRGLPGSIAPRLR